jgi:hypothetical protein
VRAFEENKDAAARRYFLMSFRGMGKSIQNDESASMNTGAPAHRLDEFPAGYSLAACSPAEPASASPAESKYAALYSRRSSSFLRTAFSLTCKNPGSGSTLAGPVFCPKDGEYLSVSSRSDVAHWICYDWERERCTIRRTDVVYITRRDQ